MLTLDEIAVVVADLDPSAQADVGGRPANADARAGCAGVSRRGYFRHRAKPAVRRAINHLASASAVADALRVLDLLLEAARRAGGLDVADISPERRLFHSALAQLLGRTVAAAGAAEFSCYGFRHRRRWGEDEAAAAVRALVPFFALACLRPPQPAGEVARPAAELDAWELLNALDCLGVKLPRELETRLSGRPSPPQKPW